MMIKKLALLTGLSVTAFSVWAQGSDDTLIVTANRFQQPVNTVLAPTDVVTRADIDRWQSRSVIDVLRRLPGVDIAQNGGVGQSASVYVRGTEAKQLLLLIDGVPVARSGISNDPELNQIPLSLVQRIEYIRGPRSAVYGSGAIGGVVNVITKKPYGNKDWTGAIAANTWLQEHEYLGNTSQMNLFTMGPLIPDVLGLSVAADWLHRRDDDRNN